MTQPHVNSAKVLAERWQVQAAQCLYSSWGNFFARPSAYPLALFDETGYLLVASEPEILKLGGRLGKRLNVPGLISRIPGYTLVEDEIVSDFGPDDANLQFEEGEEKEAVRLLRLRNDKARELCLKIHGPNCAICGFNTELAYGNGVKSILQVHHLQPLSQTTGIRKTDPHTDLLPVCPNCHAVIHSRCPVLTIEEVRSLIKASAKPSEILNQPS